MEGHIVNERQERVSRLQMKLRENGWFAFAVTQHVDQYYLSGTMQAGVLWIPVEGVPIFYIRKSVARAMEESVWPVEPIQAIRSTLGTWRASLAGVVQVAVTYDTITLQQLNRLEQWAPDVKWADGSALLRELRMIKTANETESIRAAANTLNEALKVSIPTFRPGMRDIDMLAKIEWELRLRDHTGLLRVRAANSEIVTGTLGSGEAIALPSSFDGPAGGEGMHVSFPKGAGRHVWKENEALLVDIGCSLDGYVIDQTRTVVFGELDTDLMRAYQVTEAILRETESKLRPGVIPEQLYFDALAHADREGLAEHFMGYGADQAKFLGHGIGLEIDEWPVLAKGFKEPLQPGMVIAIEPKFTFPGRGVVGIEDTYLITENGYERLTVTDQILIVLN